MPTQKFTPMEKLVAIEVDEEKLDHMPTQLKLDIAASLAVLQLEVCPDPQSALDAFIKDVEARFWAAVLDETVK
jgi:hypothetical protein